MLLSLSCALSNADITKMLIRAQADVNCGSERCSPLTMCCRVGFVDGARWLIEAGARCDTDHLCVACNHFHNTPRRVACIDLLVANIADINATVDVACCEWPIFFHALAGSFTHVFGLMFGEEEEEHASSFSFASCRLLLLLPVESRNKTRRAQTIRATTLSTQRFAPRFHAAPLFSRGALFLLSFVEASRFLNLAGKHNN